MGIKRYVDVALLELLTDASLPEIAAMKSREPMEVKMELAARIVADFHSAEAKQAGEDFNREVRQGGEPADNRDDGVWDGRGNSRAADVSCGRNGTHSNRAERLVKAEPWRSMERAASTSSGLLRRGRIRFARGKNGKKSPLPSVK